MHCRFTQGEDAIGEFQSLSLGFRRFVGLGVFGLCSCCIEFEAHLLHHPGHALDTSEIALLKGDEPRAELGEIDLGFGCGLFEYVGNPALVGVGEFHQALEVKELFPGLGEGRQGFELVSSRLHQPFVMQGDSRFGEFARGPGDMGLGRPQQFQQPNLLGILSGPLVEAGQELRVQFGGPLGDPFLGFRQVFRVQPIRGLGGRTVAGFPVQSQAGGGRGQGPGLCRHPGSVGQQSVQDLHRILQLLTGAFQMRKPRTRPAMGPWSLLAPELAASLADAFAGPVEIAEQGFELEGPHALLGRERLLTDVLQCSELVAGKIRQGAGRREGLAFFQGRRLEESPGARPEMSVGVQGYGLRDAPNGRCSRPLLFDQGVQSRGEVEPIGLGEGIGENERPAEDDLEVTSRFFVGGSQRDGFPKPIRRSFEVGQCEFGFRFHGGIGSLDLHPAKVEGGPVAQLAVVARSPPCGLQQTFALIQIISEQGR